mmetsp:Transcript_2343/g.5846  ORF Transcript_2343/g.5846 Transcript_2343/m.5846 type:complete len:203 (-) Transcript_2343:396-1004(-)
MLKIGPGPAVPSSLETLALARLPTKWRAPFFDEKGLYSIVTSPVLVPTINWLSSRGQANLIGVFLPKSRVFRWLKSLASQIRTVAAPPALFCSGVPVAMKRPSGEAQRPDFSWVQGKSPQTLTGPLASESILVSQAFIVSSSERVIISFAPVPSLTKATSVTCAVCAVRKIRSGFMYRAFSKKICTEPSEQPPAMSLASPGE